MFFENETNAESMKIVKLGNMQMMESMFVLDLWNDYFIFRNDINE